MAFRLSLIWGEDWKAIAKRYTNEQLDWYFAFYSIEPWGSLPEDIRHSRQCGTIVAAAGIETSETFLPNWVEEKDHTPLDSKEIAQIAKSQLDIVNAKLNNKRSKKTK